MDKLASLHLAQQFLGVPAHVAGSYLVAYDLTFRINNKSTTLGKTIGLDKYLKISGECVGRVCQHGVIDLLDPVGCIMPCIVNEMGVGGHGIDLAADGPELLILVRQIFQFGGTDKGKVRGIEEKYAPLA